MPRLFQKLSMKLHYLYCYYSIAAVALKSKIFKYLICHGHVFVYEAIYHPKLLMHSQYKTWSFSKCSKYHLNVTTKIIFKKSHFKTYMGFIRRILIKLEAYCVRHIFHYPGQSSLGSNWCKHIVATGWPLEWTVNEGSRCVFCGFIGSIGTFLL